MQKLYVIQMKTRKSPCFTLVKTTGSFYATQTCESMLINLSICTYHFVSCFPLYLGMFLWNGHILYVLLQNIVFCGPSLISSLVRGYCIAFNFTVSDHEMNVVSVRLLNEPLEMSLGQRMYIIQKRYIFLI